MKYIFATKSIDEAIACSEEEGKTLRKVLGPIQITLLGIGAIIGAGIFATIGTAAAGDAHRLGAGPSLMLSFVLAGVVCSFAAFCYAEFASMVPVAGSAYTYAYSTLGEVVAWIIGWDLIIEYGIGNVAVAISWANYLKTLLAEGGIMIPDWVSTDFTTAQKIPGLIEAAPHVFGVPIVLNIPAFLIVAAITVILVIGVRESARFNAAMVVTKLIVLSFFIYIGFQHSSTANWHPFMPNGPRGMFAGAAVIFFAFIGFDAVSTVAEEAKNPRRDIPIGILGSLILCTIFYVVVAAVFTGMISYPDLSRLLSTQQAEPLTIALQHVNVHGFAIYVVALGSVIAHTAVLLVFQMGQPRIFFAMARDGLLPPFFSKVHPKYGTPWTSTILTGLAVGGLSAVSSLDEMVDLTNIGTLFAFILVCLGVMVLRVKEPERPRSFRVPFGFLMPVLGVLGCLGLIYYLPPSSWLRFAAWLNMGLLIYVGYGSRNSTLTGRSKTQDPLELDVRTSYSGAWLGICGALVMMAANAGDALLRPGGTAGPEWWFPKSAWLWFPLVLNVVVLGPTVVWRAWKVKQTGRLSANQNHRANLALILGSGELGLISLYLLLGWFHV